MTTYDDARFSCVEIVDTYAAISDAITSPRRPTGRKVSIAAPGRA
ncbi:MAG: hypothetical protein R3C45_18115 [Phycisphaerales bacterium]